MRARGQNRRMTTNAITVEVDRPGRENQSHWALAGESQSQVSVADVGSRESSAARWDAVASRNRAADGPFVYAVRSTGGFFRPSCPSRRPRRDRVQFFDTPGDARAAGFRACKRCRPDSAAPAVDPWIEKIRRACVYLSNVEGHPSLATLARRLGGSPYHLQRNFKRL